MHRWNLAVSRVNCLRLVPNERCPSLRSAGALEQRLKIFQFLHIPSQYVRKIPIGIMYTHTGEVMQKPLHERSYGRKCCPNHGKRYGELLKAITWFDGEVERCCCFSQPIGDCIVTSYALLLYPSDVNPGAPKRPRGAPKRPRVRTSDHKTCCQHKLWKAETVL